MPKSSNYALATINENVNFFSVIGQSTIISELKSLKN